MALLKKSKIMLLDEISSNLDMISENKVYDTIYELIKSENITALVITHRNTCIKNDSNIIVIENGQCVYNVIYDDKEIHDNLKWIK